MGAGKSKQKTDGKPKADPAEIKQLKEKIANFGALINGINDIATRVKKVSPACEKPIRNLKPQYAKEKAAAEALLKQKEGFEGFEEFKIMGFDKKIDCQMMLQIIILIIIVALIIWLIYKKQL